MTCHSQLELGFKNLTVVVVAVAVAVVGIPHSSEHWLAIASNNVNLIVAYWKGF